MVFKICFAVEFFVAVDVILEICEFGVVGDIEGSTDESFAVMAGSVMNSQIPLLGESLGTTGERAFMNPSFFQRLARVLTINMRPEILI